jgi:hypothetical protein
MRKKRRRRRGEEEARERGGEEGRGEGRTSSLKIFAVCFFPKKRVRNKVGGERGAP